MPELLFTLIYCLLVIVLVIAVIILYRIAMKLEKKEEAAKKKVSVKDETNICNVNVQKIICKLKVDLQATKIIIARFHNGGNYVNGNEMKKFSITFETEGGTYIPMMDKNVGVFNSRYSIAFAYLVCMGDYCLVDREACEDWNFKRDMKEYDFESTNLFLMKQFDGRDEGFVGVNFRNSHVMGKEERQKVKELIPRIVGLLNMNSQIINGAFCK